MKCSPGLVALLAASASVSLFSAQVLVQAQVQAPTLAAVADPCEGFLAASHDLPATPGRVVDALSGDTLLVRIKNVGLRRVKLAGLKAPQVGDALFAVSRFHLARMSKGLLTFVVMDLPKGAWPDPVTAAVEDFTEAQIADGMGRIVEEDVELLGTFGACRCRRAEAQARQAKLGVWR
ncbi:MAG TPA: hypothetical protein PKL14_04970 [Holophaga sp.]|jgi:endonuclease YncB( thermonuclease family)|nr:hypothetical protein [Holophaga sp.]